MAKHQPYSRRELNTVRRAWFIERRGQAARTLAVVVGALVVVTVVLVVLWGSSRFTWYVLGVTHAVAIAIGTHFWNSAFLAHNRDAIRHLRGAWGEENTTMELETARRRRLIWDWVDGITLERGDIDHVVVTRRGGVVVIDSKWRNGTNDQDRLDMAAAAKKVQLRAEGVTRDTGEQRTSPSPHQRRRPSVSGRSSSFGAPNNDGSPTVSPPWTASTSSPAVIFARG